ncbi:hypothetical protein HPP92_023069 [Vanilla planifolia]|uniref:Oleosin n=1 Tax=Vanilla planifolia TaxID=51239 RepID=A0A835UHU4_VANPL|nr:hypothetical protein HPP92_023069 [Vanilla planifolia]
MAEAHSDINRFRSQFFATSKYLIGSRWRINSQATDRRCSNATAVAVEGFFCESKTFVTNSGQLVGFLALAISGAILLFLTGVTLAGAILCFIFLAPILLFTSPVWVPAAALAFGLFAATASVAGVVMGVAAGGTWLYRYLTGRQPVGSDRVDYARTRIADTASHVKGYAREYGGYFQSRIKDAAPGA